MFAEIEAKDLCTVRYVLKHEQDCRSASDISDTSNAKSRKSRLNFM